jgi:hypothetical protein
MMGLSCVSGVSHPGTATEAGLVKPRWLESNWGNFYAILLSVLPAHHPCPLLFYLYYQFLFFSALFLAHRRRNVKFLTVRRIDVDVDVDVYVQRQTRELPVPFFTSLV